MPIYYKTTDRYRPRVRGNLYRAATLVTACPGDGPVFAHAGTNSRLGQ